MFSAWQQRWFSCNWHTHRIENREFLFTKVNRNADTFYAHQTLYIKHLIQKNFMKVLWWRFPIIFFLFSLFLYSQPSYPFFLCLFLLNFVSRRFCPFIFEASVKQWPAFCRFYWEGILTVFLLFYTVILCMKKCRTWNRWLWRVFLFIYSILFFVNTVYLLINRFLRDEVRLKGTLYLNTW